MLDIQEFKFNPFAVCTRIISDRNGVCIVVDPGFSDSEESEAFFRVLGSRKPSAILITHNHMDHVCGVPDLLSRFDVPVYMNPADRELHPFNRKLCNTVPGFVLPQELFPTSDISDGDVLEFGEMRFEVIGTPGHSPGGVCFLEREEKVLLSGDTLFAGTIGRSDLYGGDYDKLIVSIMEKLIFLDGGIRVCPGHGRDTSIAEERVSNPFLEPFNEKEELDGEESEH